jgi:TolB-like protein
LKVERHDNAADSVAVLPFTNTGGADAEYLSDGIAESLINNLARIPKLRVVPRSTVFRYKNSDLDPQALGRELQARLLLMGKVMQRGDRLMVQATFSTRRNGNNCGESDSTGRQRTSSRSRTRSHGGSWRNYG